MAPAEPLIVWTDALMELLGFVAVFCAAGAVGFRFAVLRGLTGTGSLPEERRLAGTMAVRGAWLGAVGAWVTLGLCGLELRDVAAEKHLAILALLHAAPEAQVQLTCLVLAAVGFVMAARRSELGWMLAALGVVVTPLSDLAAGELLGVVKPLHMLAAGLWIGTLFYVVAIAIPAVWRSALSTERRSAAVASLIRSFSPLALIAVPVLTLLGVITAWRSLHGLRHLWSTPYGYALLVKVALVAVVAGWGFVNWRRRTPRLGSEATARDLWRSAWAEVSIAGGVLAVTAILVSLPSPE